MKQLMLVIAISIISVAVFACGPAVGRAVGDAQVDVDATLAEMGEPTTEAEKELYAMMKEIDRLHKEERNDLVGALEESGIVIDSLIGLLDTVGNELDEDTLNMIGAVVARAEGVEDIDQYFQSLREQAHQATAREAEINQLLENEERATWDRIKFLNEQLDQANAEKAEIKKDLDKAHVNLDKADKDEDKWISSNLDKEQDIQVLEARMERASGKFEVVTAMLDQVLGEDDSDEQDALSDFEKSAEEAGRYQAAAAFHECIDESGVELTTASRNDFTECKQHVRDQQADLHTGSVEIVGDEVVTKPNYMAMIDDRDVGEAIDTFVHCVQATSSTTQQGALTDAHKDCRHAAKEIHHDAAGNGTTFADEFSEKIAGNNADARRTRKFIDIKADAIGDPEFKEKLDKVMYQPGRSKDEVRDAFRGLLEEAKEDLHCDPKGLEAKPCDEFDFSSVHHEDDRQENRRMPIAHKYEDRMEREGGDTYGASRVGDDNSRKHRGIRGDVTKEQFDRAFTGGHDSHMRDRVKDCVDDGNSAQECLGDVRNDMREERNNHQSFNEGEFHRQKDERAQAHRRNYENTQGGGQAPIIGQAQDNHQDHFGGIGDGAGKRGHNKMMQCMKSATGGGAAQFNNNGDYTGGASFADAADECMADTSRMMQASYGNQDMGNHAGIIGAQGMTGGPQQ